MSWFSGKDDARYEALRDGGEQAFNKADELAKDGDVSKASRFLW